MSDSGGVARAFILAAFIMSGAAISMAAEKNPTAKHETFGKIVRNNPALDELLADDAKIEKLAEGFKWAEGPIWLAKEQCLLFSDIPPNSIMKWSGSAGLELFMKPSGYTGVTDYGREPGSNGLTLDFEGRLICCEHGDRRVSVLTKLGGKRTLADNYQGKRLNSPNDVVLHSNRDIYFTDPPYGLPDKLADKRAELDFCGVYRIKPNGEITLLAKEMTYPNGLAFSPDEKTLYVAQSDPAAPIWRAFKVKDDGTLDGQGSVFFDASPLAKQGLVGLPDGMKVDRQGNLFATGPGGVLIISPDGKHLGTIHTGEPTANCAWGDDGGTLYITANDKLARIQTKTRGAAFPVGGKGE